MARGRRVNSSGEKSKKLLLEKAIELFSTYGYHQTKISDIVKAASLTQPTFYLYFQSKESLFNDLNEKFQNDLIEIIKKTEDNKRLINECNEKIEEKQDELLDIPREIDRLNYQLMLLTMEVCYDAIETNTEEIVGATKNANELIEQNLRCIFDYFIENPNLTKIGFYEAEQSSVLKQLLVSKIENVINDNSKDYPVAKRVNSNVLAQSLVGSMERLTLTNLLTNKSNPEKLAEEISLIYFSNEQALVHQ